MSEVVSVSRTQFVQDYLHKLTQVLQQLDVESIAGFISQVAACRQRGGCIYICGNGGSASTASHLAVDLGKGASYQRRTRFKVLSLADNVSWLTALANDIAYEDCFAEQLKNFCSNRDMLVVISASGNSPNILQAAKYAREVGCYVAGLTGQTGGRLRELADLVIHVPSLHFGHIEDGHLIIAHMLAYYFMESELSSARHPADL